MYLMIFFRNRHLQILIFMRFKEASAFLPLSDTLLMQYLTRSGVIMFPLDFYAFSDVLMFPLDFYAFPDHLPYFHRSFLTSCLGRRHVQQRPSRHKRLQRPRHCVLPSVECNYYGVGGCGRSNGDPGFGSRACCVNGVLDNQDSCVASGAAPCIILA